MDEITLQNLKGIFLFQLLSTQELEAVAEILSEKNYAQGEVIFSQGQEGDTMFIVNTGTVKVTRDEGQEKRELVSLYSGDFFGEIALFERTPRTATVTAVEEASLLQICRNEFARLISQKPHLGIKILYRIIQIMGKRLQRMNDQSGNIFI